MQKILNKWFNICPCVFERDKRENGLLSETPVKVDVSERTKTSSLLSLAPTIGGHDDSHGHLLVWKHVHTHDALILASSA